MTSLFSDETFPCQVVSSNPMASNPFFQWCLTVLLFSVTSAKPLESCQVLNETLVCATNSSGPGWIVIQQRFDGSLDFNRDWDEYRDGFGEIAPGREFWLGLKRIHQFTKSGQYELLIEMRDAQGEQRYARYAQFVIAGEWKRYKLTRLQGYSGTAGNIRTVHALHVPKGQSFSTVDADFDSSHGNCADFFGGGWWYNDCGRGPNSMWGEFTVWNAWKNEPLHYFRMSIRARE